MKVIEHEDTKESFMGDVPTVGFESIMDVILGLKVTPFRSPWDMSSKKIAD